MAEYGIAQRRLGSGLMTPGIAGEVMVRGRAVYMSAADGLWYYADSDALATMPVVAVTAERAAAAGQIVKLVLVGLVGRGDWAWTRGDPLYISGANGVLTQTAPATNKQSIAVAMTANMIYVNPGAAGLDMSMMDYEVQTGIIAEPATASKGNGHAVVVHNETEERDFVWVRTDLDTKWSGVEML